MTEHLVRHRDDDYIDEIRIITRERYKTSGLSGDEWRFSKVIQLYRKGVLLWERAFNGRMSDVASYLPWQMVEAGESGKLATVDDARLCFQPGCANVAVSTYELIEGFGPQDQRLHPEEQFGSKRRRFCQKHLRRGDCGREDSDANYRVVSGPGPDDTDWSGARMSESARVNVAVDSLDDIPAAVEAARKAFDMASAVPPSASEPVLTREPEAPMGDQTKMGKAPDGTIVRDW
jgi:hypothetical protein